MAPCDQNGGCNGSAAAPAAGNPNNGGAFQMKHNPGLETDWSSEELAIFEEGIAKHASIRTPLRYAIIAQELPNKTLRDVALRCRWLSESVKENGKRRREDLPIMRKKDRKGRATDSSTKPPAHLAARPNVPSYAPPMLHIDNDDDLPFKAIGGLTGQLFEHNAQALNQISTNLSNCQIQENISLFCQTRDNILKILNDMNDVPEIMKQMPPLPVKINEDLANSIIPPRPNLPAQT